MLHIPIPNVMNVVKVLLQKHIEGTHVSRASHITHFKCQECDNITAHIQECDECGLSFVSKGHTNTNCITMLPTSFG